MSSKSQSLLADALAFLKREQAADITATVEWDKMTGGRMPFKEGDQAMVTFRAREALIARIESSSVETQAEPCICPYCSQPHGRSAPKTSTEPGS